MKIFGIGIIKTGTTTLGTCLKQLGFNHVSCSQNLLEEVKLKKDFTKVFSVVEKHESFEDLPWLLIYKELDKQFPNSKFILTTRKNKEIWLNSYEKHCYRLRNPYKRLLAYGYPSTKGYEKEHLEIYENHIKNVKDYFKDKPNKLLEVCWEQGDGWKEVCKFLHKPVPESKFPWKNKAPIHFPSLSPRHPRPQYHKQRSRSRSQYPQFQHPRPRPQHPQPPQPPQPQHPQHPQHPQPQHPRYYFCTKETGS